MKLQHDEISLMVDVEKSSSVPENFMQTCSMTKLACCVEQDFLCTNRDFMNLLQHELFWYRKTLLLMYVEQVMNLRDQMNLLV